VTISKRRLLVALGGVAAILGATSSLAQAADIVKQPEFKAQLEKSGYQLVGSTPAALATHIESEITRWTKVVKESGATVD
jgi:tripartite-type tricarboxylate transporter receptor subunit TctC